jgi:DNA-binding GntR family transcriptional regulator
MARTAERTIKRERRPVGRIAVPRGNKNGKGNGSTSLGGAAYDIIKRAIVTCELQPGEEVTQASLIARYRLTNAQGRYALVRLTQEGWVRPLAQRGYLVAPLTIQDLEDTFELRMLLEPSAMRRAAGRVDAATLKYLRRIGTAEYTPGDVGSIRAFLEKNREFYMTIVKCTHNRMLVNAIDRLFDSSMRLLYFSMIYSYEGQVVRRGHQKLLAALEKGDGAEAERLRLIGLRHGKEVIQKALHSMSSIMNANLAG